MAREARIYQHLNLKHGMALPISSSPHTAAAITLREGANAVTVDLRQIINNISGVTLGAWGDLNPAPASVAVTVEYSTNSGGSWQQLGSTAISGVVASEIVLVGVAGADNDGDFTVALADDAITTNVPADGTTRFRLNILITDSTTPTALTFRIYQPIGLTHGVSLPMGDHTETGTTELREGAMAVTFDLATILNNITDFDIDSWGELNPPVNQIAPEMEYSTNSGSSWQVLGNSAIRGLVHDEVTFTDDTVTGAIAAQIQSDTINQNTPYSGTTRFRIKVTLTDNDHSFVIYIPVDILHGMALPTGVVTRDAIDVQEGGGAVALNLLTALNAFDNFNAASWSDINPEVASVTATLEHSSDGTTWTTLGATAFRDVDNTELTADTTGASDDGMMEVELAADSILQNQDYSATNGGFRINILIEDNS